ncbi:hypothetical protein [Schleiferilactobacillus shenzhenensis]|uniref:Uncharacterized protein n=1 Tax=Schleiferilactobacillus shenzhenensis LY-73 TaxID=1231336 RepID=U4TIQ5_9LACO|nr:hypothetical protein [Schleiferilactobacillus shenzhenensis]ERL64701.1 hypothetical protein L248_0620 [Schleiferilactobacillus shenzhenensis LY-73]
MDKKLKQRLDHLTSGILGNKGFVKAVRDHPAQVGNLYVTNLNTLIGISEQTSITLRDVSKAMPQMRSRTLSKENFALLFLGVGQLSLVKLIVENNDKYTRYGRWLKTQPVAATLGARKLRRKSTLKDLDRLVRNGTFTANVQQASHLPQVYSVITALTDTLLTEDPGAYTPAMAALSVLIETLAPSMTRYIKLSVAAMAESGINFKPLKELQAPVDEAYRALSHHGVNPLSEGLPGGIAAEMALEAAMLNQRLYVVDLSDLYDRYLAELAPTQGDPNRPSVLAVTYRAEALAILGLYAFLALPAQRDWHLVLINDNSSGQVYSNIIAALRYAPIAKLLDDLPLLTIDGAPLDGDPAATSLSAPDAAAPVFTALTENAKLGNLFRYATIADPQHPTADETVLDVFHQLLVDYTGQYNDVVALLRNEKITAADVANAQAIDALYRTRITAAAMPFSTEEKFTMLIHLAQIFRVVLGHGLNQYNKLLSGIVANTDKMGGAALVPDIEKDNQLKALRAQLTAAQETEQQLKNRVQELTTLNDQAGRAAAERDRLVLENQDQETEITTLQKANADLQERLAAAIKNGGGEEQYDEAAVAKVVAFLNDPAVVVIGGYKKWQSRLAALLPEARFFDTDYLSYDVNITRNAKAVLLNTAHLNHSMFNRVKENVGERTKLLYSFSNHAKPELVLATLAEQVG